MKYLQQKIKDMDEENTHLKKQLDDYKSFNNRRMLELGEWKERISNGNLLDNPEDLKKSYEDYLRLKKVSLKNKVKKIFLFFRICKKWEFKKKWTLKISIIE